MKTEGFGRNVGLFNDYKFPVTDLNFVSLCFNWMINNIHSNKIICLKKIEWPAFIRLSMFVGG